MRRSEDIHNEFFVHHINTLVITQRMYMYTEQEILLKHQSTRRKHQQGQQ